MHHINTRQSCIATKKEKVFDILKQGDGEGLFFDNFKFFLGKKSPFDVMELLFERDERIFLKPFITDYHFYHLF